MKILWGGATAASQYEGGFEEKKGLYTNRKYIYDKRGVSAQ